LKNACAAAQNVNKSVVRPSELRSNRVEFRCPGIPQKYSSAAGQGSARSGVYLRVTAMRKGA